MTKTNFGSNYMNEVRDLLSRIKGGMVNQSSLHPDYVIPNGSPEYRKTTIEPNTFVGRMGHKLRSLIERFSTDHTKSGSNISPLESVPAR